MDNFDWLIIIFKKIENVLFIGIDVDFFTSKITFKKIYMDLHIFTWQVRVNHLHLNNFTQI
jgi:hypothetical protein